MAWICRYGIVDCPECKRDGIRLRWQSDAIASEDRVYFRIPYADKEAAKALGARWDADRKLWYGLNSNPKLSELGKRWRSVDPPKSKPSGKPPVPDLFDVRATVAEAPTAQPQPEPVPGSIPWDVFMPLLREGAEQSQELVSTPATKDNSNAR